MAEAEQQPMQGWVSKMGGIFHTWKRRWLVLSKLSPPELQYKENKEGSVKGSITLTGARVMTYSMIAAISKWPHSTPQWPEDVAPECRFAVATDKRTFFFVTPTPEEAEQWVQALRPITDVGEDRNTEIADKDQLVKMTAEASSEDNHHLLKLASHSELPTADATKVPEKTSHTELIEIALDEVKELKEIFFASGFELAEWGYLGLSMGTAFGFSIRLERSKERPLTIKDIEEKGNSAVQKAVLAMLHRANNVAVELEDQLMKVSAISLSVSGFGIAIPSVTASLSFRDLDLPIQLEEMVGLKKSDQAADKKPEAADASAAADAKPAEEEGSKGNVLQRASAAVLGAIGHTAGAITAIVTKPFKLASQSFIQKLVEEVQGLRKGLAHAGLSLQGNWLSITIGTYVGLSVTVTPLAEVGQEKPADLSTLQRVILSALVEAYSIGQRASSMDVKRVSLTLSGLGLAVPFLSATVFLGHADEQEQVTIHNLAESLEEKLDEDEEQAAKKAAAAAAAAKQSTSQAGASAGTDGDNGNVDRKSNFILESVTEAKEAALPVAAFVGRATLRAIYATGDAAEEVLSAVYNAVKYPFAKLAEDFPSARGELQTELQKAAGVAEKLPLKVANPSLSLSFGTQFGASFRLEERERGAFVNHPHDKIEAVDTSHAGHLGKMLHRIVSSVHGSVALLETMREQHAHIDLVSISASGFGLGIPVIAGSVYIGRDADDADDKK